LYYIVFPFFDNTSCLKVIKSPMIRNFTTYCDCSSVS